MMVQQFEQNGFFVLDLSVGDKMLEAAPAADIGMRTFRLDSVGARFEYLHHHGFIEARAPPDRPCPYFLRWQGTADEDRLAVDTAYSSSFVRQIFDIYRVRLAALMASHYKSKTFGCFRVAMSAQLRAW